MHLSSRQHEILSLIGDGLSDKEIAAELGITTRTVRTHLERLFRENELHSRAEAVARSLVDGQVASGARRRRDPHEAATSRSRQHPKH